MSERRPSGQVSNHGMLWCNEYIPKLESCCARSDPSESMGNSTSIIRGPFSKDEGYDPAAGSCQL
jgi:hypothetical protein